MATKPGNRSGSQDQGAFGDENKQDTQGMGETKYDKDSTLNLKGEKQQPKAGETQAAKSSDKNDTGH